MATPVVIFSGILLITVFIYQVSVFLKSGAQNSNGRFSIPIGGPVPNGFEVPGTIRYRVFVIVIVIVVFVVCRYYNERGNIKCETRFDLSIKYGLPHPPGSWALRGDRVISFGTNMYAQ